MVEGVVTTPKVVRADQIMRTSSGSPDARPLLHVVVMVARTKELGPEFRVATRVWYAHRTAGRSCLPTSG